MAAEKAEYRKKVNELSAFFPDLESADGDADEYEYSTGIDEIDRVMNIVGWERAFGPLDLDSSQVCSTKPLQYPSNFHFFVHYYMSISPQEDDKENSAEVEQFAPPAKMAKAGSSQSTASKPTASATTKPAAAASATLAMGNVSGLLRDLIDVSSVSTKHLSPIAAAETSLFSTISVLFCRL